MLRTNRKFARLGAVEDAIHILGGVLEQLDCVWPVRGEAQL
jgi:hypothetical protein